MHRENDPLVRLRGRAQAGPSAPMPASKWKTRVLAPGLVLAAAAGLLVVSSWGVLVPARDVRVLPVVHDGDVIAYVAWLPIQMHDNAMDAWFAQRQHRLFLGIAAVAVAASFVLAWVLSRILMQPVRRLSVAMHEHS